MIKEYQLEHEIEGLIEESRNQAINGPQLANVHRKLGAIIGEDLVKQLNKSEDEVAIVAVMRAGLPLAEGVWDFFPNSKFIMAKKVQELEEYRVCLEGKTIIVVDSVINTGKSILPLLEWLNEIGGEVIVATNVIFDQTVQKLKDYDIFAIRQSKNSYKGTKSIDTGNRLFNTIELE